MDLGKLLLDAKEHIQFVLVVAVIVAAIFVVAAAAERVLFKGNAKKIAKTRKIAVIGMLSAISVVLMLFEIPLPFAPEFYKLDFSELPVLIGSFALGPVSGVLIELCKILLKLVIKGTTTAFVGDFANFIIGCSMIAPAAIVYHKIKTKTGALIGLAAGTLVMTVFGSLFNAFYLLPTFAALYGMPLDAIVGIAHEINSNINSVGEIVLWAVVPFNLLKGGILTVLNMLLYKRISPIIKGR